ncbi:hypothetical protein VTH06DRAFT_6361 [Thermothelomyces fergusii]
MDKTIGAKTGVDQARRQGCLALECGFQRWKLSEVSTTNLRRGVWLVSVAAESEIGDPWLRDARSDKWRKWLPKSKISGLPNRIRASLGRL